ncbi:hypothetical protein [Paraburkholderia silvatlantica]|uniref:Uncharacterized protein n=1 Tax=Paraburkholderia silvatlantica TaxID=321895 RepID=A0ABR6FL06_9BURK|nr:hypothetical protein [Paraburkholderia silvatlantica]MBB2928105.1 hypothetical protein [Paraburkholderia silvatlantica]
MGTTTGVGERTDNEDRMNLPERRMLDLHARGGIVPMLLGGLWVAGRIAAFVGWARRQQRLDRRFIAGAAAVDPLISGLAFEGPPNDDQPKHATVSINA